MKSCATCIHGDGEGTIRFCRVKKGAAFNVTDVCAWHTGEDGPLCGLITATIEFDGIIFEMQPNESHLLEDTREELDRCGGPLRTVVDVGAHVGMFALQAAARGATVYAVEPSPLNVALLKRNIERNGMGDAVHIIEKAVALHSGERLPLRMGSPFPGQRSLAYRGSKLAECLVETISLKDLINFVSDKECDGTNFSQVIDVLKMDIEGYEFILAAGPPEPYLGEVGYVSISLHDPTNESYFDFGGGKTREEHYATVIAWLKASGFGNARVDNHMAIGTH